MPNSNYRDDNRRDYNRNWIPTLIVGILAALLIGYVVYATVWNPNAGNTKKEPVNTTNQQEKTTPTVIDNQRPNSPAPAGSSNMSTDNLKKTNSVNTENQR